MDFCRRPASKSLSAKKLLIMPSCDGIGHAGRMLRVAQALRAKFDGTIEFAGNGPYGALFPEAGFRFHEVSGGFDHNRLRFLYAKWSLAQLKAFWHELTGMLREVVKGELALYDRVKPDLIVWDGRFSVPMSAWIARVPVVSVLHPHHLTTPFSARAPLLPSNLPLFVRYPLLGAVTRLPSGVQAPLARVFWKTIHGVFLKIYNTIVADFGAAPADSLVDIYRRYQAAIFPDLEVVTPTVKVSEHFHYTGPLVWEPDLALPEAVEALSGLVYVTMGSSGPLVFKQLIAIFAQMPEIQVVMTLARLVSVEDLAPVPPNVHLYDYLPGSAVAARSRLVICHGSTATVYQALAQGVPIIGIPFNIPDELSATQFEALGVGVKLYAKELTFEKVARTIGQILAEPGYRTTASRIGSQYRLADGPLRAADVILAELEKPSTVYGPSSHSADRGEAKHA